MGKSRLSSPKTSDNQTQSIPGSANTTQRPSEMAPPLLNTATHARFGPSFFSGTPRPTVQAKMTVGPVGDAYEQEADSVARQVVRNIQRQDEDELQLKRPEGTSLSAPVRESATHEFGVRFHKAPVHRETSADILNRAIQPGAFTTAPEGIIQRALSQDRLNRLKTGLGQRKFGKVQAKGKEEVFDALTDQQLTEYKMMPNVAFDALLDSSDESLVTKVGGYLAVGGQTADLIGALMETGESAGEVVEMLPSILGNMSGAISNVAGPTLETADSALEGIGGGIGGIKDTLEGGSSIYNQGKWVEGGLTTLGGLSGIASLIPGIPDVVGMAGAGAKTMAGATKMVNNRINQNAIAKLKSDAASDPLIIAALEVLEDKLGYWDGAQQTVLGAVEGTGAMFGGVGKWATGAFSKGVETLPGMLSYAGRAIGSTVTSRIDSNAAVNEREAQEKAGEMGTMRNAVSNSSAPSFIGRLHRLAVLIDPDYANAIDEGVEKLPTEKKKKVKRAIREKATWNPS